MKSNKIVMEQIKKIALIAHDNMKHDLVEWALYNKALLRMAVVWNIPIACNRTSADFLISSPLMTADYERLVPDYREYRARRIPGGE